MAQEALRSGRCLLARFAVLALASLPLVATPVQAQQASSAAEQPDALSQQIAALEAKNDLRGAEALLRQRLAQAEAASGAESEATGKAVAALAGNLERQRQNPAAEPLRLRAAAIAEKVSGASSDAANAAWLLVGENYWRQGRYADVEKISDRVLKDYEARRGADSPQAVDARVRLGNALKMQRRYPESEKLFRDNLAIAQRLHGPAHVDTGIAMLNLGYELNLAEKSKEAASLFETGIEILKKDPNRSRASLIPLYNDMGGIMYAANRNEDALNAAKEMVSLQRTVSGDESAEVARTLYRLSLTAWDYTEGVPHLTEAARILRAHPDADPSLFADVLSSLSIQLGNNNRRDEALSAAAEGYKIRLSLGGDNASILARDLSSLARATMAAGKATDAAPLYKEAVEKLRTLQRPEQPFLVQTLCGYSDVLLRLGRRDEAQKAADDAVAELAKVSDTDPSIDSALWVVGSMFSQRGEMAKGEPVYARTVKLLRKRPASEQNSRLHAFSNWSSALEALNRHEEAVAVSREALTIARASGPDSADTAQALLSVASTLLSKPQEADPLVVEAIAILRKHPELAGATLIGALQQHVTLLGNMQKWNDAVGVAAELADLQKARNPDDVETARAIAYHGQALWFAGRAKEATPLYEQAVKIMRAAPQVDAEVLIRTIADTGSLYAAQQRADDAIKAKREAYDLRKATSGADDPKTAFQLIELGYTRWQLGKLADAEADYDQAVKVLLAHPEVDPGSVASNLSRWGSLLSQLGRNDKALSVAQDALKRQQGRSGVGSPETVDYLMMVADLEERSRPADAGPHYQQAFDILKANGKASDPKVINAASKLGWHLVRHDKPADAERLFQANAANGSLVEKAAAARGLLEVARLKPGDEPYLKQLRAGADLCAQAAMPPNYDCYSLLMDEASDPDPPQAQRSRELVKIARRMSASFDPSNAAYYKAYGDAVDAEALMAMEKNEEAREPALSAYTYFASGPEGTRSMALKPLKVLSMLAQKRGEPERLIELGEQTVKLAQAYPSVDFADEMQGLYNMLNGNILLKKADAAADLLLRINAFATKGDSDTKNAVRVMVRQGLHDIGNLDPARAKKLESQLASNAAPAPAARLATPVDTERLGSDEAAVAFFTAFTEQDGARLAEILQQHPELRTKFETGFPLFKPLFQTIDLGVKLDKSDVPPEQVVADPLFWSLRDGLDLIESSQNAEESLSGQLGRGPVEFWILQAYRSAEAK